ncbi:unnamed protein product [Ectocarpus sp. 12 AP-2014]
METFAVDGFPHAKLMLALFTNVKNAADLKRKYLNRIALLDAGLVLSVFQLRVAAAMAVEKEKAGKMKTRRVRLVERPCSWSRSQPIVLDSMPACMAMDSVVPSKACGDVRYMSGKLCPACRFITAVGDGVVALRLQEHHGYSTDVLCTGDGRCRPLGGRYWH